MNAAPNKTCLVTGVGPDTGAAIVRRFAQDGYAVAMLARNADRLEALAADIPGTHAFVCDVGDPEALESALKAVRRRLGAPSVVVHNAVGGAFGDFLTVDPAVLEANFRTNCLALLNLARLTTPDMIEAGVGALLCTGNTSAFRGKAQFASFAPTKAAQRILLESIARRVGPAGVHAAYIAIDAVIDTAWTRALTPDRPDEFFCQPVDIAEECFRIAHQPRSAWSFNVEIRPFNENW